MKAPHPRDTARLTLSREVGYVVKPHANRLRVALAFPNTYFVGMSNLGLQTVYTLFNARPDTVCERVFLPPKQELASLLESGSPLVTIESQTPVREFDVLAFSVSFEWDYTYVLTLLRLAGLPLRAAERTYRHPLVVIGGAVTFVNPEPLALFADVIAAGEGESLVPALVEACATPSRSETLRRLAAERGFYIPSFYDVDYGPDGTIARYVPREGTGAPSTVRKAALKTTEACDPPATKIFTPDTEFGSRFLVEVVRGCANLCRFCWAGYNYLPVRGFSRATIVERARQVRGHTDKIGLVSTAVCDHPEINEIVDDLSGLGFQVSVASLRLDDLSPEFVFKLVDTGVEGLTLAPECGSDRMRKVLNKQFTNEDILARARWIFENGIQNLKLYFMVGLPFETHADVEAIVTLTEQIREIMLEVGRPRGRIGRIHPSVNPFVPKPGTPFQWLRMENVKETDAKLQYLRKAFAKIPNVEAICKSARTGFHQTILALGDRRVADALEHAVLNDCDLKRAARAVGLDPAFYVYREKPKDEVLPWDIIDNGVSRDYFWKELDKSKREALSPHCPEIQGCIRCGVCEDQPNPSYPLPEKWKELGTSPRYLKVTAAP